MTRRQPAESQPDQQSPLLEQSAACPSRGSLVGLVEQQREILPPRKRTSSFDQVQARFRSPAERLDPPYSAGRDEGALEVEAGDP